MFVPSDRFGSDIWEDEAAAKSCDGRKQKCVCSVSFGPDRTDTSSLVLALCTKLRPTSGWPPTMSTAIHKQSWTDIFRRPGHDAAEPFHQLLEPSTTHGDGTNMSCSGSCQYDVLRLPLRLATGGAWLSWSFCSLTCLKSECQSVTHHVGSSDIAYREMAKKINATYLLKLILYQIILDYSFL